MTKHKVLNWLIIFGLLPAYLSSQTTEPIFPTLSGAELLEALRVSYKPDSVLPFSNARDTLFARIYAQNDSLTGVYTGHTIYLDPTQDPTITAFMGGGDNGINTEHTYPRSKGADAGNPRADMHHLYPTRIDVNAIRASFPFAEIPDNQTTTWYFKGQSQSSIPTQNIDQYSEAGNRLFEPREDHKGNVARAVFYFYTMYRQEADLADNAYFEEQRQTLCQWHYLDPVDDLEWNRNLLIANYQDGKANPFILDCTLAARAYCPNTEGDCVISSTKEQDESKLFAIEAFYPNPFQKNLNINYTLQESFDLRLRFYNLLGEEQLYLTFRDQAPGKHELNLSAPLLAQLPKGLLFCEFHLVNEGKNIHFVEKLIKE